jgi:hypothetical protein
MTRVLTCPATWKECTRGCAETGRCAQRAEVERGETCGCTHPFDPHVLVALEAAELAGVPDVPVAGVILCPVCECAMTWSVAGYPDPPMPAPREAELLRREVFGMQKAPAGTARGEVKEQDD